jgi:hypothetical protein
VTHVALPDGCPHIAWQWEIPPANAADPNGGERGALLTQFATGTASDDMVVRRREAAAQGLMFAEAPHLCQVDGETGRELWAVPLTPDLT